MDHRRPIMPMVEYLEENLEESNFPSIYLSDGDQALTQMIEHRARSAGQNRETYGKSLHCLAGHARKTSSLKRF